MILTIDGIADKIYSEEDGSVFAKNDDDTIAEINKQYRDEYGENLFPVKERANYGD